MPRSPRPSLPDLAPYLEKLRDFSPGQILLGFVGVHGCFARALGSRRETPGLRRPGPGPAVSVPSTVQPSLSRANTHTLGPASPGRAPLRLSVGTVVSALPPPAPLCLSPSPSCGLGAAASQVPGCAAARGEAERAEEGGPCSGRRAAARPPLRLHTRCSAPPEPRLRRRQRPVTLRGGGCGVGWVRVRAGGSQSHPSVSHCHPGTVLPCAPPPARGHLGSGGQRSRVRVCRNLPPFPFYTHTHTHTHTHKHELLLNAQETPRKKPNCHSIYGLFLKLPILHRELGVRSSRELMVWTPSPLR